ncbi:MAG TPA: ShlB/FhaC/HecB family hemolysin secretion/activation protein, partial [Nitrospiraceae bacterium]|nr:ShlB/FhaC/HecB family hemolysin secretion/activation protein [Nitrospiraceae bacterium]
FGARFIQPLPSLSSFSQSLSAGLDYKDFAENVRITSDTGLETPISYLHTALQYNGNLRTDHTNTGFNLVVGLGLRPLGNSTIEFENKRFLADGDYFYLRGGVQHERQSLWGLRLFGRLAGQFSVDPLISNEQFAIGGLDTVRGYLDSEQLGDTGFSGSLEVRSPPLTRWLGASASGSHFFGFFDAGVVSTLQPLPRQASRTDLSSWGLGFRAFAFYGIDADLTWAYPLVYGNRVEPGESRVHVLMRYSF